MAAQCCSCGPTRPSRTGTPAIRDTLLAARERRVRPGRDDKVVAAWNGLAIAALAECGLLLAEPGFTAAAGDAAALLARVHLRGDRLARTSRAGVAGPSAGVLEDYACVAEALLVLSGVTGRTDWVTMAGQLLDTALARFSDGVGTFYDTADDGEALIYRPADPIDGPTPSGTFAMAGALLGYGALTGSARHREAALAALGVLGPIAPQYPRAAGAGLAVAEAVVAGPAEIAVVGPPGDPRTAALHTTALLAAPPGAVIALGDGAAVGEGGGAAVGDGDGAAVGEGGGAAVGEGGGAAVDEGGGAAVDAAMEPVRPGRGPRRPFRCWQAGAWWRAHRPPTCAAISPAACRSPIPWTSGPPWSTRLRRQRGRDARRVGIQPGRRQLEAKAVKRGMRCPGTQARPGMPGVFWSGVGRSLIHGFSICVF